MRRWIFALGLLVGTASAPHAAEPQPLSVTLTGVAVGDGYRFALAGRNTGAIAQTVREKGDRVRVDFEAGGQRGTVLRDAQGAWLISALYDVALPLPASTTARPMIYDADAPCRAMDARCERAPDRIILGRPAVGWSFRHAGSRGPDGTDSGTLWLDRETGVLLVHRSEDMSRRHYEWRATSVDFTPLDDALFVLPAALRRLPTRQQQAADSY